MSVESVHSEFHFINDGEVDRKIAYSRVGEFNSNHIFLCLPGLLETRESFHHLFSMVEPFDDCCWLSIDYCGRGNSDPLSSTANYSFSKYLADTEDLIESLIVPQQVDASRKLHLIGTSMGGILAMHLVNRVQHRVDSVILNDIGLYLHWSSLMTLYQNIKESNNQLSKLKVDARAIDAVQSRSHFDLPYDFDVFGMRFNSLLKNFKGKVVLLHNAESPICPTNVAHQSQTKYTNLKIWTLDNPGHPAKWEESMVMKLSQLMRLKPKSMENIDIQVSLQIPEIVQSTNAFGMDFIESFLKTSQTHFESTIEDPRLWFNQLVKRIKFWKGSYS
jgi:pimeloyl-ACP methyl ester carboxylesterase